MLSLLVSVAADLSLSASVPSTATQAVTRCVIEHMT